MIHTSTGILRYSRLEDGGYKLIVEVDPGIVQVARALVPRAVRLNTQRYAPHISVVRQEVPPAERESFWGLYEGHSIEFEYSPLVHDDTRYYWLLAYCPRLHALRIELGLPYSTELTRPPDESVDCFHITVGNCKRLSA